MLYTQISEMVKKAGKIALNYFLDPRRQRPRLKEDRTIVTEADLAVQEYITGKLLELTPDYTIVGEETAVNFTEKDKEKLKQTKYIWTIDPVDGTASFSNNIPNWVVSLALMEYGEPIAGWIYAPVWDQLYTAYPGEDDAYLNGEVLPKCNFDKTGFSIGENTCMMIDSKTFRKYALIGYKGKIRSFGSTAFHITMVGAGTVIGANSIRNKIWDIAGASAIAKKCNVNLRYLSGKEIDYKELLNIEHTKEDIITCNDAIFETVIKFFRPLEEFL
jgi:myo-inositol-1(or 4)-monophosphatase